MYAGMPTWWIVAEVVTIGTTAVIVLIVDRFARRAAQVPLLYTSVDTNDISREKQS